DGFYLAAVANNGKKTAALVYGIARNVWIRVKCRLETIDELTKRFYLATPEETEQVWKDLFEGSNKTCQHNYFHGRCRNEAMDVYCETGRRTRTHFVLSVFRDHKPMKKSDYL
ncbi:hypothetical protein LOAG_14264, partial [Loa loa]